MMNSRRRNSGGTCRDRYRCESGEEEDKVKRNYDETEDCLDMWCLIVAENRWAEERTKKLQTLPTQHIDLDSGPYFLLFSHNSQKIHRNLWTTVYNHCQLLLLCKGHLL